MLPSMALSVSTVIPAFNRAHLIRRALESALPQQQPGDEVLVVDDGSTDDTARVVAAYGDRLRYIRTENRGAGAARNRGIEEARGDLVAFLDSDDEWMPGKLDLARRWMAARPDIMFVFSDFAITNLDGSVGRRFLINWHGDRRSWNEILGPANAYSMTAALPEGWTDFPVHVGSLYEREFAASYVLTSSFVARRREGGEALRFNEDLPAMEDLYCFGRLSRLGPVAYFDTETAWQHGQAAGRISQLNLLRRAECQIIVLDRVWGSDQAFLAKYGPEYRRVIEELRLQRAVILIRQGRTREARAELDQIEQVPFRYRALSRVPGPLVRGFRSVWRTVRGQPT